MQKINAVIYDVDGMVVKRQMRFSDRLAKDYGVRPELIVPFFQNEFKLCLVGKADLKQVLLPYLIKWDWKGGVDNLLGYWFENENDLNMEIIDGLKAIRDSGNKVFLTTSNEKYRTAYLFNKLGLVKHFDGCISSSSIGHVKSEPNFWKAFISSTGIDPVLAFVWDDDEKNLLAAKSTGFNGDLFKDTNSYIIRMEQLGLPR